MRGPVLTLLCALPIAFSGSALLAADPAPVLIQPPAPYDAFADAYAAIQAGMDEKQSVDMASVGYAQRTIALDAELEKIDEEQPGLTADVADAVRPVQTRIFARLRAAYRPRMIAAVRDTFTASEAADVAAFFRTSAGRNFMASVSAAFDAKAAINKAQQAGLISPEEAKTAGEQASQQLSTRLSFEDSTQIGLMAETTPALQKLGLLTQRLGALRLDMDDEPWTAQEKTDTLRAVQAGIAAHKARAAAPAAPPAPAAQTLDQTIGQPMGQLIGRPAVTAPLPSP